jgi:alpha-N-arabinofuranosidase
LTLTVVNPHATEPREAEVTVRGAASVRSARARVLTAGDLHAQNTFENPRGVEPRDEVEVAARGASLRFRFPPASVTRLQLSV